VPQRMGGGRVAAPQAQDRPSRKFTWPQGPQAPLWQGLSQLCRPQGRGRPQLRRHMCPGPCTRLSSASAAEAAEAEEAEEAAAAAAALLLPCPAPPCAERCRGCSLSLTSAATAARLCSSAVLMSCPGQKGQQAVLQVCLLQSSLRPQGLLQRSSAATMSRPSACTSRRGRGLAQGALAAALAAAALSMASEIASAPASSASAAASAAEASASSAPECSSRECAAAAVCCCCCCALFPSFQFLPPFLSCPLSLARAHSFMSHWLALSA